jgi:hypothetical protein
MLLKTKWRWEKVGGRNGNPFRFEVARASCPWELIAKMAMPLQTEPLPTQEEPSRFQNRENEPGILLKTKGRLEKVGGRNGNPFQFEVARASCPCEFMAKMAMPLQTEPLPTQEEPHRFQNLNERPRNVIEKKGAVGKSRRRKRESI